MAPNVDVTDLPDPLDPQEQACTHIRESLLEVRPSVVMFDSTEVDKVLQDDLARWITRICSLSGLL